MGICVVAGAMLICPFGTVQSCLQVTSQAAVLADGKPVATIADKNPNVNFGAFGMCSSLANPQVASATAAALGVLTPQPCNPVIPGTWSSSGQKPLISGKPALSSEGVLQCAYGGAISVVNAGQKTTIIS